MPDKMTRWNLFDKLIVAYSLLMVLFITIWGRPLKEFTGELIFYLGCFALVYLLVKYVPEDKNSLNRFIRIVYPVVLFTFLYRATGGLMFLIHDQFLDLQLTTFEYSLFGVHPTMFIDRHLLHVLLNEFIMFTYFSYYFMIPAFVLTLYYKKDFELLKRGLAAICLMFFASYLLFFLYPIEGPRWYFMGMYQNDIEGPIFRELVNIVMANGAVRGGCMPSSHFGVALVIWLYVYERYRKHALWLGIIVAGLGIGTFWGRFHYVSDVVVGGLIGLFSVIIVNKIDNRRQNSLYKTEKQKG